MFLQLTFSELLVLWLASIMSKDRIMLLSITLFFFLTCLDIKLLVTNLATHSVKVSVTLSYCLSLTQSRVYK